VSPQKVLFICLANTCRSPMAEAIARGLGGGRVDAYSAGFTPTRGVAPGALRALSALGYPADGLSSKGLDQVPLEEMDVIVSLIGNEGLRFLPPSLPGERVSWLVRDPYGEDDDAFVAAARTIESKVASLVKELTVKEPPLL
jgi:arsenate reductase